MRISSWSGDRSRRRDLPVLHGFRPLISPELSIVQILPQPDRVAVVALPNAIDACCPFCGRCTRRVHSRYMRRLTDPPWRLVLWKSGFTRDGSGAPDQVARDGSSPRGLPRRSNRKRDARPVFVKNQLAIGFALGGEPGSRLSRTLAMPISGNILMRMIPAAGLEPPEVPCVVGIDDLAWRKRQRYGTLICDLERNRVLDLLPDRNVYTVASWAERHPGIEVIARDRASVLRLARVAALPMQRRSATTGICFRTRARHYVLPSAAIARQSAAGKAIIAEMVGRKR